MNWRKWLALLGALMVQGAALAQYPDHAVRIVVPFGVGGSNDLCARYAAQQFAQITGAAFVVENKLGAAGQIAYQMVANSPADGYTLVSVDGSYPMLPFQYRKLAWNLQSDLVPVTMYCKIPYVLVASQNSHIRTLKDLVAAAKANPGKLNFGSGGVGNSNHLLTELMSKKVGIQMLHIPFKGAGDAATAVMAGTIDVLLTAVGTVIGPIKAGQVVPLAVTSEKRLPVLPDVPTFDESGVPFEEYQWYGLMAPKGTPKAVVDYLQQQARKMTGSNQYKDFMTARGFTPFDAMPPEELGKLIASDTASWREVFNAVGLKPE